MRADIAIGTDPGAGKNHHELPDRCAWADGFGLHVGEFVDLDVFHRKRRFTVSGRRFTVYGLRKDKVKI